MNIQYKLIDILLALWYHFELCDIQTLKYTSEALSQILIVFYVMCPNFVSNLSK